MSGTRLLRLGMLAWMFAAAVHAAPPPEIAAAAPLFPDNTRAVLAVRLTPEVREWMFSSFFFNPAIYKKVLTEQADKFAKATGFNPLEDVEWDVVAIADNPRTAVIVAIPKKDPTKMLEVLQKDPKTAALLKIETIKGTPVVRVEQLEIALQPKLIAVAPAGTLKPILERAGDSPTNAKLLGEIAASAISSAQAYGLAAPAPETIQALAQHPNVLKFGGAVLGRVKQVAVAMDAKDISLVFKLDSKDAAIVAGDQIKGLITSLKGMVSPHSAKPPVPEAASPFEHIDPKILAARIGALAAVDALDAIVVTPDGEATRVSIPKDKMPLMRAEGATLFIAGAAVVGAFYGAASKSGVPGLPGGASDADTAAQCHAIQQRLSAAVELYNTDKKKKARLEEIADDLVKAQYLEAKPEDPGQPAGSFGNYFTAPDGRVSCKIHGSPDAGEPNDSERAQPEKSTGSPAPKTSPDEDDGGEQ